MISSRYKKISRINTWLGLVLFGTFAALISSCASTALETKSHLSHEIGKEATAEVDSPMLIREEGTIENKRRWVGFFNSPDGWEIIETTYSDDYKRKELIYKGSSDSKINVTYRELGSGSAIPKNQENLTFDLSESNVIVVKDFQIKVLKADGDSISYIVTKD